MARANINTAGNMFNLDQHISKSGVVFHYTTLQNATEHILPKLTLRFGDIKNTNDPKERSGLNPSIRRHGGNIDSDAFTQLREHFNNETFHKIKALCFCRNTRTLKGFLKPRMWAQYADNSKGVCIAFDRKKIISSVRNAVQKYGITAWHGNVKYNFLIGHREENLNLHIVNASDINDARVQATKQANRIIVSAYSEKFIDFRDEAEFRVIVSSDVDVDIDISYAIKSVIVGPFSDPEAIKRSCSSSIEIQQLMWNPQGPTLTHITDPSGLLKPYFSNQ